MYTTPASLACPVFDAFGRPPVRELDDGHRIGCPTMHFALPEPTDDELEAAAADLRIAEYERDVDIERAAAHQCAVCRCVTEGVMLAGTHVPLCPECFAPAAVRAAGLSTVEDLLGHLRSFEAAGAYGTAA